MLRAGSASASTSRSRAPVTCAGERGGARPAEVPVPASRAAQAAASSPVRGALGIDHFLPVVSGETESVRPGRGGH